MTKTCPDCDDGCYTDDPRLGVPIRAALAATPAVGGEREALEVVRHWDEHESNPASYGGLPERVRKVVDAALALPASPLRVTGASDIVAEAACLIWSELCPGSVMGDDDRPYYEAVAKAVLSLPPSPLRGRDREALVLAREWMEALTKGYSKKYGQTEYKAALAKIDAVLASAPEQPAADPEIARLRTCITAAMGCLDAESYDPDERLAWRRLMDALEGQGPRDKESK